MQSSELRPDGRFQNELRKVKVEFKTIENSGYVLYSQGCTVVRTSIGRSKDKKQVSVNLVFSQTSRNEHYGERKLYDTKQKIASIFTHLFLSETNIEIDVQVLQDNGSLFSTIINSISLALCYTGISHKYMAVSITLNDSVDLCYAEENKSYYVTVVYSPLTYDILYLETFGKMQKGDLMKCIETARTKCDEIYTEMKANLVEIANMNKTE